MLLQAIRGKAATWIVKILFILLIISFGAWGVTDYLNRSTHPVAVATVGKAEIRPADLNAAVERERERLRAYFGALDRDQMRQLGLTDQALDQMITRLLIEQEAGRLGVTISDAVVRQAIQSSKAFQNEVGQFDRNKFAGLISRAGYSEDRFIAEMRRDLTRSQIVSAVTGGLAVPAILTDTLARYRGEKRVAALLSVGFDSVQPPPDPDAEALAKYHDANKSRFMIPELRKISYILLSVPALASEIAIAEDDLRTAYDGRLSEFTQPERRQIDQLLFADEAAAKQAADKIAAGGSFRDVGGEYADLGEIVATDLPAALADAAFALPSGGVTAPIRSDFGWHLFATRAITPQQQSSFDEVRGRLQAELARDKALDRAFEISNRIDEKLAGGASLEDVANQNGLTVRTTGAVDRSGRPLTGDIPADFPASPQLMGSAFGLASGESTGLLEIRQPVDGFIALRVDEITPATPKSLEAARDDVLAAWRDEQRANLAKERADALAERLRAGEDIEAVGTSVGLAVQTPQPVTRDGRSGDVPAGLISDLFAATPGQVVVGRGAGVMVVAQLKAVQPFDATQDTTTSDSLTKGLKEGLSNDLFSQFTENLKTRFPVVINRDLLQQLN